MAEQESALDFIEATHLWSQHAQFVGRAEGAPNPFRTIYGVEAQPGGVWDVMTRFHTICERLQLPFHVSTSVEVNPATGDMAVAFGAPEPTQFPTAVPDSHGRARDCTGKRAQWTAAYALRLAALLANIGFAVNTGIIGVTVIARAGEPDGQTLFSLGFNRVDFHFTTAKLFADGTIDDAQFDVDPAQLLAAFDVDSARVEFDAYGWFAPTEDPELPESLCELRTPLGEDARELPDSLKSLLRADRVCDLDIADQASLSIRDIHQIAQENADSPVTAVVELGGALTTLKQELSVSTSIRQPLYCEREALRLLVSEAAGDAATRYRTVPGAIAAVRSELARFDMKLGQLDDALRELQELQRISPTSVQGGIAEAMAYSMAGDTARAVDAIRQALKLAVVPDEVAFLYCLLGQMFAMAGETDTAIDAYYVASTVAAQTAYTGVARQAMEALLAQIGSADDDGERDERSFTATVDARPTAPSRGHALGSLQAAGIPISPTQPVIQTLTRAAMLLADAGVPLAAYDGVEILAEYSAEPTLLWMCRALQEGAGCAR